MNPAHAAVAGWISSCVHAAATLAIADLLDGEARSIDELAAATKTSAPVLLRMLRVLASVGIFVAQDDGRFANTPDSLLLRTADPGSLRHFCMLAGGAYDRAFGDLLHTLRSGESAFRAVNGASIYEVMDRDPALGAIYDRAMEDLARPVGALLAAAADFTGATTVVDVGGGSGTLLKGLLASRPSLRGICLDRADVCGRARDTVDATLRSRLEFVPGDFFESVPSGADVYLLKNVLHNWADDSSLRILATIRAAMTNGARLFVLEPLARERGSSTHELLDDLFQMVVCEHGTTARSETAMRALLERASFAVGTVTLLPSRHSVVEAVPR
jgi:hypothetical protein